MSIRVKRGKLGSWNSQNPTLDDGQLGVVRMTDGSWSLKVGDGSSRFANLQCITNDSRIITGQLEFIEIIRIVLSDIISINYWSS